MEWICLLSEVSLIFFSGRKTIRLYLCSMMRESEINFCLPVGSMAHIQCQNLLINYLIHLANKVNQFSISNKTSLWFMVR